MATILLPVLSHASLTSTASISGQQFAADNGSGARVNLNIGAQGSETLPYNPLVPRSELHLYSFFETDSQGDRSFDFDQTAYRTPVGETGHIWLGRTHPLKEGFHSSEVSYEVSYNDAIGSNWVQNQSSPLQPRVAGWIGAGAHFKQPSTGLFSTVAFSPVFLPSFGPSVQYSETTESTGARFANLPPRYVTINSQQLPLRYRIDKGDVMNIVLQPQYFGAVGQDTSDYRVTLMGWSAPNPSPQVTVSGILRVNAQDANVLVTATPAFPRQTFLGARWTFKRLPLKPDFESAYEMTSHSLTLSARLKPMSFLESGYLTSTQSDHAGPSSDPTDSSPLYAKNLWWAELSGEGLVHKFKPALRIERHLNDFEKDQWLNASVSYFSDEKLTLYAAASIITGQDYSYFGTWRSLDSVSMGARYTW